MVRLVDLPEEVQKIVKKNTMDCIVVKRFLYNDYKVVKSSRVEALGENRVDKYRASVSQEIGAAYDIVVATLNGDI